MAMMTLDLGGEPFLVDEETFTAIRKAESARDEYIESMMPDEEDEDEDYEEFEDKDDYPNPMSTVSPMSTMKSIVWLNDSQYARVDSQDALDLYDDEVLEAFVGDDGEVQFMTPGYALELAEGNQIRVDSEGIWTSTWRSDAKAKKTTCGRGWIMGPGGKCVRNNRAGQGAVKVGQESAGLKKLGQSNLGAAASSRLQALRKANPQAAEMINSALNSQTGARPNKTKREMESERKYNFGENYQGKHLQPQAIAFMSAEMGRGKKSQSSSGVGKGAAKVGQESAGLNTKGRKPAAKNAGSTKSRAQKQMDKYAEMTERVSKRPKRAPKNFNPNLGETKSQRKSKA